MLKVTMPSSSSPSSSPSAAASSAAAASTGATSASGRVAGTGAAAAALVPDYWIDGSNRDTLTDYYELESELGRPAMANLWHACYSWPAEPSLRACEPSHRIATPSSQT